jgi:hypothetical protein
MSFMFGDREGASAPSYTTAAVGLSIGLFRRESAVCRRA